MAGQQGPCDTASPGLLVVSPDILLRSQLPHQPLAIAENRQLDRSERELVAWILAQAQASEFLQQLGRARIVSRCGCGCASVDFNVDGVVASPGSGMTQVGDDYYWTAASGGIGGVFVFARNGRLSGLEVWSVDGVETPSSLPEVKELRNSPYD